MSTRELSGRGMSGWESTGGNGPWKDFLKWEMPGRNCSCEGVVQGELSGGIVRVGIYVEQGFIVTRLEQPCSMPSSHVKRKHGLHWGFQLFLYQECQFDCFGTLIKLPVNVLF